MLDTDLIIFMLRGLKPSTRQRARRERARELVARCRGAQAQGDVVGLSAITVSELEFGAYNSGDYDTEIAAVRKILTPFEVLDYYGVPWEYEPRTFVLEEDAEGRVLEAFTPDFYLPDQDLYVELTVMKQSLVTRKNRKLRKLRARYPNVKVKLFYKRDLERLAQHFHLDLAS